MGLKTYPFAEIPAQAGQSGKYLTTNGSVPNWGSISAGCMTLLSTTTLSGTAITVSSINQSYNMLYGLIVNTRTSPNNYTLSMNANGDATLADYFRPNGTAIAGTSSSTWDFGGGTVFNTAATNENCVFFTIHNYSSTVGYKPTASQAAFYSSATQKDRRWCFGGIMTTSAITSIQIASTQSLTSGTFYLYGVK